MPDRNREKIVNLLDECIAYIDGESAKKNNNNNNSRSSNNSISSLNVRLDTSNHSRSALATPSVGLRSTAPEPPSPSAYSFPAQFPTSESHTIPTPTANTTSASATATQNKTRESDNEEDLDSDLDNNDNNENSNNTNDNTNNNENENNLENKSREEEKMTPTQKRILEENSREIYLQPIYYTLCIDSRPFGIALCKKFSEEYLCVALPESPSGQLGLRNGSRILGIDQFIIDSNDYVLCNTKFPSFAHSWFYMMGFDKIGWLSSHLPVNFFLKFDPLLVLSEGTKKSKSKCKDEECDFWRQMQDDIYRWAIDKKAEYWTITNGNNTDNNKKVLDVMSMTPIESTGVQKRLSDKYKYLKEKDINKRKPEWEERNGREKSEAKQSAFSSDVLDQEIIQFDDEYKRVGTLEVGTTVGVFSKAGAWLEIRSPIEGWIKFYDATTNTTYAEKCQNTENDNENDSNTNKSNDNSLLNKIIPYNESDLKTIKGSGNDFITNEKGDFNIHINSNYLKDFDTKNDLLTANTIMKNLKKAAAAAQAASTASASATETDDEKKEGKNENDNDNNENNEIESYWLSDIILNKSNKNENNNKKFSVIYFMGDLDFGSTVKNTYKHLKELQKLQREFGNDNIHWIIVRVCSLYSLDAPESTKMITWKSEDGIEHNVSGFIIGRSTTNVLKLFGLNHYDTGFFKYGLLMTNSNGDILLQPTESMDKCLKIIPQLIVKSSK